MSAARPLMWAHPYAGWPVRMAALNLFVLILERFLYALTRYGVSAKRSGHHGDRSGMASTSCIFIQAMLNRQHPLLPR